MARQLAVRTVVEWFGNLSFDKQTDVLAQMQQQLDQARMAKRAELEKQLAALGYSIPKKARSSSGERKWNCRCGDAEESSQEQGESEVPRSQDERNVVGPWSDGELAQGQAGRRGKDREVPGLM